MLFPYLKTNFTELKTIGCIETNKAWCRFLIRKKKSSMNPVICFHVDMLVYQLFLTPWTKMTCNYYFLKINRWNRDSMDWWNDWTNQDEIVKRFHGTGLVLILVLMWCIIVACTNDFRNDSVDINCSLIDVERSFVLSASHNSYI